MHVRARLARAGAGLQPADRDKEGAVGEEHGVLQQPALLAGRAQGGQGCTDCLTAEKPLAFVPFFLPIGPSDCSCTTLTPVAAAVATAAASPPQMVEEGRVEEARAACAEQMAEAHATLGASDTFRSEYFALWEQQRKAPILSSGGVLCAWGQGAVREGWLLGVLEGAGQAGHVP